MTNSATSTKSASRAAARNARRAPAPQTGFQAGHFFLLMSMLGATAVVMTARETHPVALLLLSAAVICAGFVGLMMSRAVTGFFQPKTAAEPLAPHSREALQREKQLVLRSIKELEFDKAMGKISETDFASISAGLRARALTLMRDLDRPDADETRAPTSAAQSPAAAASATCASCGTPNDTDARFCKSCGTRMAQ
jgi:hypothetical protein